MIVIIVLAGAVAVAIAPRINAKPQSSLNSTFSTSVTSTPAVSASLTVITMIFRPVFISTSFLKNLPTPNAINASATSLMNPISSMICSGIKFRQYGPIRIPARIYPLTFGIFSVFVSLVMINPANKIMERARITSVSGFSFSKKSTTFIPTPLKARYRTILHYGSL